MNELHKALEQFAESVGERMKEITDAVTERLNEQAEQIAAIAKTIESMPSADHSDDIASLTAGLESLRDEVKGMVDEAVQSIEIKPGKDGRDAIDIEMLPCIDEEKSYPRGTYAIHKGGVFRAYQKTVGMKGWECVLNGVADLSASVEGKQMHIELVLSDGTTREVKHTIPQPKYCGVYKSTDEYLMGDSVTSDGSLWIAKEDHPSGPPWSGDGWQLAVKRGRDGRGLYAIARDAGYQGTEKELLDYVLRGEVPSTVVHIGDSNA